MNLNQDSIIWHIFMSPADPLPYKIQLVLMLKLPQLKMNAEKEASVEFNAVRKVLIPSTLQY